MGESNVFLALLLGISFFVIIILITRLFGAWMLRINEVIKHQKLMLDEIRKFTNKKIQ